MKSIVLFGAGASYGANAVFPRVPPLGPSLFGELTMAFPQTWGSLPSDLTDRFREDFEDGMGMLWRSGSHAISRLLQELAIYFAQFSLSTNRTDAYSRLIIGLEARGRLDDVRFSTLNYECLFEISLNLAGRRADYFGVESSSSTSLLWKLHGSCNFLPHGGVEAGRGVTFGSGVTFGTGIRACEPTHVPAYCNGNTALYPVMAIYAAGKPIQIAPEPMRGIQSRWMSAIREADRVAIVGVKPRPEDDHIWTPLAETDADLGYVGSAAAGEDWAKRYRGTKALHFIGQRFGESTADLANWL